MSHAALETALRGAVSGEVRFDSGARAAPRETLIVANGFSCREQIEGLTGRPTLHLAEALARSLPHYNSP